MDNLDVLLAVLDGTAGADVEVRRCDATERRMYVQIAGSAVPAHAKDLAAGLRQPIHQGSVACVEPGGSSRTRLRKLGGCVHLEPPIPLSSGRRSPGSGSRRR